MLPAANINTFFHGSGPGMSHQKIPTKIVPCDLCGSEDQRLLFTKTDHITGEDFNLVECPCGMAFVNPMPVDEAIPRLYAQDYLKDKPHSHSLYDAMLRLLPRSSKGRLLDIGCGRGDFILRARESGWMVEGIDLIEWVHHADLPIRVGDFLEMEFPDDCYDVITAWAILEHLPRPSLFFKRISHFLSNRGTFLFTVPNFTALGMKKSCTEDIPRHLSLFSQKSVFRHVSAVGLKVVKIYHNARLYTCYPFGLVRYALSRLKGQHGIRCSEYDNRAVRLLQHRQFRGNAWPWFKEVATTLGPKDVTLDLFDLVLGVTLSQVSKLVRNYGVLTVVSTKTE